MLSTKQNVDFASYHKKQLVRFCKKFHKDIYRLVGQKMALKDKVTELEQQIEKMKKYIKACWVEENLNNYSSYITNSSDKFRDLVKELKAEVTEQFLKEIEE